MNFLLIGRPNVGKSSIYNILISGKKNIIHKLEGTTRDWHKSNVKFLDNIYIYDTPGVIIQNNKLNILKFYNLLKTIDIFFYVIDYKNSDSVNDNESINELRKLNKKIIILVNKDDNYSQTNNFNHIGIKEVFYLSCTHNYGFGELYEYLESFNSNFFNQKKYDYSIAIFGKPNVGKSTLLNGILGYDRSLTGPIAGTTSDIVEEYYDYNGKNFKILDTAGIFKKNKIDTDSVNYQSIKLSLDIIKGVELSFLLIDCKDGFDNQSKKILSILLNKSSSVIILFNKIDLIKNKLEFIKLTKLQVKDTFSQAKNISLFFLSAKIHSDIDKLKKLIVSKTKNLNIIFQTGKINSWLKKVSGEYTHPLINGKTVKFKYGVQISTKPVTIKLFANFSNKIKKNYITYLKNHFCKTFNVKDKNIKLIISSSKNPFN